MFQERQKCPNCAHSKYANKRSLLYCPYCKSAFPLKLKNEKIEHSNEMKKETFTKTTTAINNNSLKRKEFELPSVSLSMMPPLKKRMKVQTSITQNYGYLPVLKQLPIKVDIIRHPKESLNMCSSVHACVLAPNDVQMYEFPNIPLTYENTDERDIYLLYPSKNAIFLDEMNLAKVKKIVVIENRWSGNRCVYDHPSLKNLPHCQIRNRTTMYWRWQEHSSQYLATIEAIYYTIIDCYKAQQKIDLNLEPYNGQFDDLLLLFAYDHARIRENIQQNNIRVPNIWML